MLFSSGLSYCPTKCVQTWSIVQTFVYYIVVTSVLRNRHLLMSMLHADIVFTQESVPIYMLPWGETSFRGTVLTIPMKKCMGIAPWLMCMIFFVFAGGFHFFLCN
jgi:hypothetical protein